MTDINTAIVIQGKQDPWEIYQTAYQQILYYSGEPVDHSESVWSTRTEADGREFIYTPDRNTLSTRLAVYYRPDGNPVFNEEEARKKLHGECHDPGCEASKEFASQLIVLFATPLSYTDHRNWNAGNLHSGLVWCIGGLLDSKKVPWKWHENMTQTLHEGYEELSVLPDGVNRVRQGLVGPLDIAQVVTQELLRRMGLISDEE